MIEFDFKTVLLCNKTRLKMDLQELETKLLIEYGKAYGTGSTEFRRFKEMLTTTARLKQRARLVINATTEHFAKDYTEQSAKMSGSHGAKMSRKEEQPQQQPQAPQNQQLPDQTREAEGVAESSDLEAFVLALKEGSSIKSIAEKFDAKLIAQYASSIGVYDAELTPKQLISAIKKADQ